MTTVNKTSFLKPIFDNIADELKALPQWVTWRAETRDGKVTKPPHRPQGGYAKSGDQLAGAKVCIIRR